MLNQIIRIVLKGIIATVLFNAYSQAFADWNGTIRYAEDLPVAGTSPILIKPGKKYAIGNGLFLKYVFSKKPAMGLVVLKVQIYQEQTGRQVQIVNMTGEYGMPSMRGAHDSGEKAFQLNKKGDYLLPIDVVMAGEWEVVLRVKDKNVTLYTGKVLFRV